MILSLASSFPAFQCCMLKSGGLDIRSHVCDVTHRESIERPTSERDVSKVTKIFRLSSPTIKRYG